MIYNQFFKRKGREPLKPLPILSLDKEAFLSPTEKAKMIWYGHSVVLMRVRGKTVLIDPMLGPDASPIAPMSVKRFSKNSLDLVDDFPEIDILLMTHDHYDHVDLASFEKLQPKVKKYVTTLGTGRHYEDWGVAKQNITEMDWWDTLEIEGLTIHCTPSRHFAGRGGNNRAKSFWGGWVIQSEKENIYFSGDGGYGGHFKKVGEKLGPFDFGFMDCGQYNDLWRDIHMHPEESVQAGIDAKVTNMMPVNWAGFALAMHHWKEPADRFVSATKKEGVSYTTPMIGEVFTLDSKSKDKWWDEFD